MNVLVIGGSGFVGSSLVPKLIQAGFDVSVLNRGRRSVPGVSQIVADREHDDQIYAVSGTYDAVIDTSSYNGAMTRAAYKAFGNARTRWIHLSSAAVYQDTNSGSFPKEHDKIGGAEVWSEYGIEKSQADQFLTTEADGPVNILRPPYLYGPMNDNDREQFIWSRCLTLRKIILPGSGDAKLQFLHVDDLADFIVYLLSGEDFKSDIYNIADSQIISITDWVKLLSDICEVETTLLYGCDVAPGVKPRLYFPFRDTNCALDVEHISHSTSWNCQYSLLDGFSQTYRSYKREELEGYSSTTEMERALKL